MKHSPMTRPQRLVLLLFLIIVNVGILRSSAFDEPQKEEKMANFGEWPATAWTPNNNAVAKEKEEKMGTECLDCSIPITPLEAQYCGDRCEGCADVRLEDLKRKAALWDRFETRLREPPKDGADFHCDEVCTEAITQGLMQCPIWFGRIERKAALWDEHEKNLAVLDWQAGSADQADDEHLAELIRDAALWRAHQCSCCGGSVADHKPHCSHGHPRETWEAVCRKAHAWDEHGWRAETDLVAGHIRAVSDGDKWPEWWIVSTVPADGEETYDRWLARAFVRAARDNKLPLWVAVAIAEKESNFDNSAVGPSGEKTLMQINPLTEERKLAIINGVGDPAYAIDWAMRNCFMPGYHAYMGQLYRWQPGHEGALREGLLRYNKSRTYGDEVMARGEEMVKADALWSEIPR